MKPPLRIVSPNAEKRTVRNKGRKSNRELRTREHLT